MVVFAVLTRTLVQKGSHDASTDNQQQHTDPLNPARSVRPCSRKPYRYMKDDARLLDYLAHILQAMDVWKLDRLGHYSADPDSTSWACIDWT